MNNADSIVSIQNVEKWYESNHVIKNLNIEIAAGEFLTLLGPSGCGKTTTLRLISGFEMPDSGVICIEGENVANKPPYQRPVNTVFQNYALFPHMNVEDNIAYGLMAKKVPKEERRKRVGEMLDMVQLQGYEKRKINQMSGGQQQRVAIARALVNHPKVLLLDEPLGALDLQLRKQMQLELKRLQNQLKITFVYVTHDQEEAMTMSDRIAVINNGILEQIDDPKGLYERPATKFVAGFIGESNILGGTITSDATGTYIETSAGRHPALNEKGLPDGTAAAVSVRPENMLFSKESVDNALSGTVRDVIFIGNLFKIIVALRDGSEIKITRMQADGIPEKGTDVSVFWKPEKGVIVPGEGTEAV